MDEIIARFSVQHAIYLGRHRVRVYEHERRLTRSQQVLTGFVFGTFFFGRRFGVYGFSVAYQPDRVMQRDSRIEISVRKRRKNVFSGGNVVRFGIVNVSHDVPRVIDDMVQPVFQKHDVSFYRHFVQPVRSFAAIFSGYARFVENERIRTYRKKSAFVFLYAFQEIFVDDFGSDDRSVKRPQER
jgi:hypothetical protein